MVKLFHDVSCKLEHWSARIVVLFQVLRLRVKVKGVLSEHIFIWELPDRENLLPLLLQADKKKKSGSIEWSKHILNTIQYKARIEFQVAKTLMIGWLIAYPWKQIKS